METSSENNRHRLYTGKEAYLSIIFSRWRKLHLISLAIALLSAFTACFTFFVYETKFHPYCPLYANLSISKIYGNRENDYEIVLKAREATPATQWGPEEACQFVLYVPLINMLAAMSWILLFCIKGSFSPNSHTKLVPSTCCTGFLVTILSFAGAVVLTRGGSTFCESFKKTELEKCEKAQFASWTNFSQIEGFYDYLIRSKIAFWFTTHTWFFHSFMSLIRWGTNADYVIAEERELREKPLEAFTSSSLDRHEENEEEDDDENRKSEENE